MRLNNFLLYFKCTYFALVIRYYYENISKKDGKGFFMETIEQVKKESRELADKSQEELVKELTESVALLPDFIVEPLKDYIKEEVTYRFAQEIDFLVEKKIDPYYKKHSFQHLIIMGLLLMLIITVLVAKIV